MGEDCEIKESSQMQNIEISDFQKKDNKTKIEMRNKQMCCMIGFLTKNFSHDRE